ncbi:hypothetical protein BH09PSE1_BH09PSE1_27250 [soil metagenome]
MSSTFKPVLLAAVAALALSACATATPYQPSAGGRMGGYAEQRLENDRYRVSFSGNSVTSREEVETGLLLRAAELTTESGFDWFATVNRATDRDTRFLNTGPSFPGAGYDPYFNRFGGGWGPSWRYYNRGYWSPWGDPFWGRSDFDVRQIDRYEATSEIIMGRGAKPAGDPNAFDAREVISNLGARVTRPM